MKQCVKQAGFLLVLSYLQLRSQVLLKSIRATENRDESILWQRFEFSAVAWNFANVLNTKVHKLTTPSDAASLCGRIAKTVTLRRAHVFSC